jgi:hypothetical protein
MERCIESEVKIMRILVISYLSTVFAVCLFLGLVIWTSENNSVVQFLRTGAVDSSMIKEMIGNSSVGFEIQVGAKDAARIKKFLVESDWFNIDSGDEMCDAFAYNNGNRVDVCAYLEPEASTHVIKFQNNLHLNE